MDNEFVEPKKVRKNILVIVILSLLVVGLGGYLVYDKCIKEDNNSKDTSLLQDAENKNSDTITLEDVKGLVDFYWINPAVIDHDWHTTVSLDEEYKVFRTFEYAVTENASKNVKCSDVRKSDDYECNSTETSAYSFDRINSIYRLLFGNEFDIEKKDYVYCLGPNYIYDKNLDSFVAVEFNGGCGSIGYGTHKHFVQDFSIKDDIISVDVLDIYTNPEETKKVNLKLYFKKGNLNYYFYKLEEVTE